jgi:hypothetical protein
MAPHDVHGRYRRRASLAGLSIPRREEVITHVAIRFQGKIWSLPKPNRHHDVMRDIVAKTGVEFVDVPLEDEGFLADGKMYLTRGQALIHAMINEQVIDPTKVRARLLTSEDVW